MAGSMTNALAKTLIMEVLRAGAAVAPAALYVGLFTVNPTDGGAGTEANFTGYARQVIAFDDDATAGDGKDSHAECKQNGAVSFPAHGGGADQVIVGFGIWFAVSGGTCQLWGELDASQTVAPGGILTFPDEAVVIQFE